METICKDKMMGHTKPVRFHWVIRTKINAPHIPYNTKKNPNPISIASQNQYKLPQRLQQEENIESRRTSRSTKTEVIYIKPCNNNSERNLKRTQMSNTICNNYTSNTAKIDKSSRVLYFKQRHGRNNQRSQFHRY